MTEAAIDAVIDVRDGVVQRAALKSEFITGKVGDQAANGLKIRARVDGLAGLHVAGARSHYTWSDSTLSLFGYSTSSDLDGAGAGALVSDGGTLVLRNMKIDTWGAGSTTVTATGAATLKVYNSRLQAHGGPLPSGYVRRNEPGMLEPPTSLGLVGSARTTLTMDNAKTYFYDSQLIANGWGVVSTEAANGYCYVEINSSKIWAQSTGYGVYADSGAEVVVNNSDLDTATYSGIIAGSGSFSFNNVNAITGGNGVMIHNVRATTPNEVGVVTMNGGKIGSQNAAFLVKSANAMITVDRAEIVPANGDFLLSTVSDDADRTPVNGAPVPGIRATIRNTTVAGNVIHLDDERSMSVALVNATLNGRVRNAALAIDANSHWKATGDSSVTLTGPVDLALIDAEAGVTITARAPAGVVPRGSHKLASGGLLRVGGG